MKFEISLVAFESFINLGLVVVLVSKSTITIKVKGYKNIDNFDRIIQKDRYVKVLFKEEMYNNISLNKFKEMYRELNQVLEQL